METIILEKPGHFIHTTTPRPAVPAPGFVRLKVHKIGICGTDLHAYEGKQAFFDYPRILGHELGIEVLEIGEGVENVKVGDIGTVMPYLTCGQCIACRRGKTNCCTSLQTLGVHTDGGMREEIILPANTILPSTTLSLEQLSLVEMLSIGAHAVDRSQLENQEYILVIGAGPIGLGVIQFAQLAGAQVILMELSKNRIEFAQKYFHIDKVIDQPEHAEAILQEFCQGELPTAVFDVTGNRQSMMSAFKYVANGGRLILVGITKENISFSGPESHRREMTLLNSRNARKSDLERVMQQMDSGAVDVDPWITHRASTEEMIRSFPSWLDPSNGVVKAILSL